MDSSPATKFKPVDVSDDRAQASVLLAIDDALPASEVAVYGHLPDEYDRIEAFFARSPHHALVWICRNMNRGKLLKAVQDIYDNPMQVVGARDGNVDAGASPAASCDASVMPATAVEESEGAATPGQKRKRARREKTTREVNKSLVNKMNIALAHTIASSQDWEAAKQRVTLTVEQQRYYSFAKKHMTGMGVESVTQMIANAELVASKEALGDWKAIIAGWRRQHCEAKKQFQRVVLARSSLAAQAYSGPGQETTFTNTQLILSQRQDRDEVDDMGLTVLQRETFKYRLVDAQKSRIESFAEEMRQRWKLDALFEEYIKLEGEMRRSDKGTGARGVRYSSVAKDHLFRVAFESDDGYIPTKTDNPDLFKHFGSLLDWGKKWNLMKRRFGTVGVFGLLPKSIGANAWFERVSQARIGQWIDMVAECNQDVMAMAHRIEPLFLAFIEEQAPPPEFLFLEQFQFDQHAVGGRLISLFNGSSSAQSQLPARQVDEITVEDSGSEYDAGLDAEGL